MSDNNLAGTYNRYITYSSSDTPKNRFRLFKILSAVYLIFYCPLPDFPPKLAKTLNPLKKCKNLFVFVIKFSLPTSIKSSAIGYSTGILFHVFYLCP